MNRTLHFMLPNMKIARQASKALQLADVEGRHIHFLAKTGTRLGGLHPTNVFENTDSIRQGIRGISIGAGLGFLAGMLALIFPPWYTDASWAIVLAITSMCGAIFGAIGMSLLGVNLSNSDLAVVKDRITRGEVLMIVSVPFARVKEIRQIGNAFTSRNVGLPDA